MNELSTLMLAYLINTEFSIKLDSMKIHMIYIAKCRLGMKNAA